MRHRQCRGHIQTVLTLPLMNKVPFLHADHKSSWGILVQIMSVDHSTISSAVYGMNTLVPDMAFYNPYRMKEFRVFAFDGIIGIRLTVQRDHPGAFDISCHDLAQMIAVAYFMFTAVIYLPQKLHLPGIFLPDVSGVNGYDHVICHFRGSKAAYL